MTGALSTGKGTIEKKKKKEKKTPESFKSEWNLRPRVECFNTLHVTMCPVKFKRIYQLTLGLVFVLSLLLLLLLSLLLRFVVTVFASLRNTVKMTLYDLYCSYFSWDVDKKSEVGRFVTFNEVSMDLVEVQSLPSKSVLSYAAGSIGRWGYQLFLGKTLCCLERALKNWILFLKQTEWSSFNAHCSEGNLTHEVQIITTQFHPFFQFFLVCSYLKMKKLRP